MAEREHFVTGIPLWLLRDYLEEEAGGCAEGGGTVRGEGWRAELAQASDHVVGSLRVGRVRLLLTGDDAAVARTWDALAPRLLRAGG